MFYGVTLYMFSNYTFTLCVSGILDFKCKINNHSTMKDIILLWTPRILSIMAILFMMMFSMDCFGENHTLKLRFLCLLMHKYPGIHFKSGSHLCMEMGNGGRHIVSTGCPGRAHLFQGFRWKSICDDHTVTFHYCRDNAYGSSPCLLKKTNKLT